MLPIVLIFSTQLYLFLDKSLGKKYTEINEMIKLIKKRKRRAKEKYQIEFSDYLIQKPQTFETVLVYVRLNVELLEVGYRGEHDRHAVVFFMVDLL